MATSTLTIDDIIKDIEKEFGKPLTITSNKRTPQSQASSMYPDCLNKLLGKPNFLNRYEGWKKSMVQDIYSAFETGYVNNEDRHQMENRMASVIQAQVDQKRYVSNHLLDTARDIRTKDLSAEDVAKLKKIISARSELFLLDETGKKDQPHFHIHLKPRA